MISKKPSPIISFLEKSNELKYILIDINPFLEWKKNTSKHSSAKTITSDVKYPKIWDIIYISYLQPSRDIISYLYPNMPKRGCVKNQCYARVCRCFSPKNKERLRGAAAWNALRDFFLLLLTTVHTHSYYGRFFLLYGDAYNKDLYGRNALCVYMIRTSSSESLKIFWSISCYWYWNSD